ncbi:hypothetical protein ACFS4T_21115 [Pseudomonas lini]
MFGEVAKWALGQWLTVNVTDGEITRIKVVLNVVLSYVAGSFGLGGDSWCGAYLYNELVGFTKRYEED